MVNKGKYFIIILLLLLLFSCSLFGQVDELFVNIHTQVIPLLDESGNGKFLFFRAVYNALKKRLLYSMYSTGDASGNTCSALQYQLKTPEGQTNVFGIKECDCASYLESYKTDMGLRWDKGYAVRFEPMGIYLIDDDISAQLEAGQMLYDNACEACNAKLDQWMNKLYQCNNTVLDADSILTREFLYQICVAGRDIEFVYGNSSCPYPPGITIGTNTFSNFTDVVSFFYPGCSAPVHPTTVVENTAECSCHQFQKFLEWNGYSFNSDLSAIQALLNTYFESFELDEISHWIEICSNELEGMEVFDNTLFPDEFKCEAIGPVASSEINIDTLYAQCRRQNAYDARQEENLLNMQQQQGHLNDFLSHYRDTCINNLFQCEEFSASCTNYEFHYTLYYYDQAGNLIKTVPPNGVKIIGGSDTLTRIYNNRKNHKNEICNDFIWPNHNNVTNYKYNTLNQVIVQYTPDGDTVHTYYDVLGRPVASQNQKQYHMAQQGEHIYSVTKYDDLGRIELVYEKVASIEMTSEKAKSDSELDLFYADGTDREYFKTYYSTWPFAFQQGFSFNPTFLQNRVACISYFDTKFTNDAEESQPNSAYHYSYDVHGNVKTQIQDIKALQEYGWQYFRTDYQYEIGSGNVLMVKYQDGKNDRMYHKYTYDADNRIREVKTSNTRSNVGFRTEAEYFYYPHGPLARVELGDKNFKVQGSDYVYTINGWIKAVNASTLDSVRDAGLDGLNKYGDWVNPHAYIAKDAYAYSLEYYTGDYRGVKNVAPTSNLLTKFGGSELDLAIKADGLYNGNITANIVSLRQPGTFSPRIPVAGYAYQYDRLNRLKLMMGFLDNDDKYVQLNNKWDAIAASINYFNSYSYDGNGNITQLNRYDQDGNAMDLLRYDYPNIGVHNRLDNINDDAGATGQGDIGSQSSNNYVYDAIGNLTQDIASDALSISWTSFGKIANIDQSNGSITFIYDALGRRIAKQNSQSEINTYTTYDASGNVMGIYEVKPDMHLDPALFISELPIYGSSRLGVIHSDTKLSVKNGNSYTICPNLVPSNTNAMFLIKYLYCSREFELTNHLGNVMVTISDKRIAVDSPSNGITDYYLPVVESTIDYYPFGMQMPGRVFTATSSLPYRFGFNGQLKDNEITGVDGAHTTAMFWEYDSRIGRRWNIDPVFKPWLSSYGCFSGNPIIKIDPSGDDDYYDMQGKYLGSDFAKTTNIRIIEKEKWNNAKSVMNLFTKYKTSSNDKLQYAFTGVLQKSSKVLTIEYSGSDFASMWQNNERGGYILLNPEKATLTFRPFTTTKDNTPTKCTPDATDNYNTDGVEYYAEDGLYDKIVIAEVHTHPTQDSYIGKIFARTGLFVTDKSNYLEQYVKKPGEDTPDGVRAVEDRSVIFTIATSSVDLFTKEGKSAVNKNNNIAPTSNLFNGKFNILKKALETYGGKKDEK